MAKPLVGIVLGSDSDLPVMAEAFAALEEMGIGYEAVIYSAHRTPDETAAYAKSAAGRGLLVIIAAAGGAAHLPGVIAAYTPLPVIGVPVASGTLHGVDALYSIVQMPPGVPVACVAVNGAKNAALLAAQIVGAADTAVRKKVEAFKAEMARRVAEKNALLSELGVRGYLEKYIKGRG